MGFSMKFLPAGIPNGGPTSISQAPNQRLTSMPQGPGKCPTEMELQMGQLSINDLLVRGFKMFQPTPLKNDGVSNSWGEMTFPTEWKVIKTMFRTTKQSINDL